MDSIKDILYLIVEFTEIQNIVFIFSKNMSPFSVLIFDSGYTVSQKQTLRDASVQSNVQRPTYKTTDVQFYISFKPLKLKPINK